MLFVTIERLACHNLYENPYCNASVKKIKITGTPAFGGYHMDDPIRSRYAAKDTASRKKPLKHASEKRADGTMIYTWGDAPKGICCPPVVSQSSSPS